MSKKLHIGCGNIYYEDCINIDIKPLKSVDIIADIKYLPFKDRCADTIIAHHCFEHIPRQQVDDVLAEWYRVIKFDGTLDIECPDFNQNCKDYIKALDIGDIQKQAFNKAFIYGGDTSALEDGHRWGYSAGEMRLYFEDIGFKKVDKIKPTKFHRDQAACFRVVATK